METEGSSPHSQTHATCRSQSYAV